MKQDLDAVNTELAEIIDRLGGLAPDAYAKRHELLTRQDELRVKAAEFAHDLDAERPTHDLEAELASLRKVRSQLIETRIGYATGKGGSAHGPASAAMVELGVKSMGAAGLDRTNARISRLEDILAQRQRGEQ